MKLKLLSVFLVACSGPGLLLAKQAPAAQKSATAQSQQTQTADPSKAAAIDPAKDAAIRRLFDVQGTKESMRQVMAGMTANMKPILESSLPPGEYRTQLIDLFLQRFQAKLTIDQLMELAVPVYDKYFSLEEIDGLTKFYQTPLGKKAISVLPQVLLETQSAGSKLGQQIGRQAMMEVLAEHPDLQKALEDASAPRNPS
ncbi:MAG TPA: DUF2059 domain-containing protein [Candidatus Methylomirabilis sp.]|nr:DUF2059 domain-containing protein [Candidatus Methylomirabilis sp.]